MSEQQGEPKIDTMLPKEQQTLDAQKDWDHPEGYVDTDDQDSLDTIPQAENEGDVQNAEDPTLSESEPQA